MHALITGGAGFIGSHLAERLLDRGDTVHVYDDLSTGSAENVAHLEGRDGFSMSVDTIMNVPELSKHAERADVIYHLAAAVGVQLIVDSPVHTIETNVRGTEIILSLAGRDQPKKVLIASTSEVYGKSTQFPFREEDDLVIGPTNKGRWSYACSKALDEFLAIAYYNEKNLPVVIARLFNTVGPRQTGRYGMVIPRFVQQALAGEPITVYGDGSQSRSFTYVDDVVRALIGLMDSDEATGAVFNIGHGAEITILDLARMIKEKTGSSSEIVFVPYDEAYKAGFEDMPRRVPDTTRIRELIGYEPTLDLPEILDRVIEFFQS